MFELAIGVIFMILVLPVVAINLNTYHNMKKMERSERVHIHSFDITSVIPDGDHVVIGDLGRSKAKPQGTPNGGERSPPTTIGHSSSRSG